MKKLLACLSLVLVACFAIVGLSACKKSKSDETKDKQNQTEQGGQIDPTTIVGTWQLIEYNELDYDTKEIVDTTDTSDWGESIVFNENNTGVYITEDSEQQFTWKKEGEKYFLNYGDGFDEDEALELKDGKLIQTIINTQEQAMFTNIFNKIK